MQLSSWLVILNFKKPFEMTMKTNLSLLVLIFHIPACFSEPLTNQSLDAEFLAQLAGQYTLSETVLTDFIESYNYKCPEEITREQVLAVINDTVNDTELSVMQESANMNWRDIYVEARSAITCQTSGDVLKGY